MPHITCGNCGNTHFAVATVRDCFAGTTWPCTWLVEVWREGECYPQECGAASWENERGYECEAGHSHVYAEVRDREGWDYASDAEEAEMMRRNGLDAVGPDGGSI